MANALIYLRNDKSPIVENIEKIVEIFGSEQTEHKEFRTLVFYNDYFYSFQGQSTLLVHGGEIVYVQIF